MNILIVEDDAIIAVNLTLVLEGAGHSVIGPVRSRDEAVQLSQDRQPMLALVDINLDGAPAGIELARTLQRLGIPSVFMSAQHAQAWANTDAALGFIAKPYSAASVCRSVDALEALLHGDAAPENMGALEVFPPGTHSSLKRDAAPLRGRRPSSH